MNGSVIAAVMSAVFASVEPMRIILPVAVGVAALAAAALASRRRSDAPTAGNWNVPAQIDRADFPSRDSPWLVIVFSSATCNVCSDVLAKAEVLRSETVAVVDVEYGSAPVIHERYRIDAVPMTLVVDSRGVVAASVVGPVTAQDLWAMVADCRSSGSPVDRGGSCPGG